ncbi:MAG: prolyl oligopeptidase family serine peptidase [Lachnospiraceae bacterium]|nr:prolyl oligopeptidase family serine peptidase [Lachnospiraceae bacterium]
MREMIKAQSEAYMLGLAADVVYMQKPYWCNMTERQLKMSIIHPREYYTYDQSVRWPLLVFLCGGGFQKMDRNAHIPELAWFAEHGFVVADVDYSVLPYTEFPEPLEEIKAAIRYLQANADKYSIQRGKTVIMGESAGAYYAALAALTNGDKQYDVGEHLDESSAVQLAVPFYPPSDVNNMGDPQKPANIRVRLDNFPDLCSLMTKDSVPMYMIHGTVDDQVPYEHSIRLYEKLQECGVKESRLTLIEGANHGDARCFTPEIKERILDFMRKNLGL